MALIKHKNYADCDDHIREELNRSWDNLMLNYAVDCYDYVEDIYLNFISEKLWSKIMLLSVITFVVTFTNLDDNKDISKHNYAALLLLFLSTWLNLWLVFLMFYHLSQLDRDSRGKKIEGHSIRLISGLISKLINLLIKLNWMIELICFRFW